jgi:hypothetical protein
MPVKPSDSEEEYFARLEAEKRRKLAAERQAAIEKDDRERERALHYMKCPKCGMHLEEIAFGDVRVDKCFNCEGLWLDNGISIIEFCRSPTRALPARVGHKVVFLPAPRPVQWPNVSPGGRCE